ncbi:MAG TPA: hypothetical protein VEL51_05340 [Vicinamibacterales bacterium]|nr:hypothetical protein [Vicinamibacterales bacterium]
MSIDDDVLFGIKPKPARMSLPAGLPPGLTDRRDHSRREALVRRILAEFDDMPGMALSLKQAGRFLGIDEKACARILAVLTRDGQLRRNANLQYVRSERPNRLARG